jgi:hypothetical protein
MAVMNEQTKALYRLGEELSLLKKSSKSKMEHKGGSDPHGPSCNLVSDCIEPSSTELSPVTWRNAFTLYDDIICRSSDALSTASALANSISRLSMAAQEDAIVVAHSLRTAAGEHADSIRIYRDAASPFCQLATSIAAGAPEWLRDLRALRDDLLQDAACAGRALDEVASLRGVLRVERSARRAAEEGCAAAEEEVRLGQVRLEAERERAAAAAEAAAAAWRQADELRAEAEDARRRWSRKEEEAVQARREGERALQLAGEDARADRERLGRLVKEAERLRDAAIDERNALAERCGTMRTAAALLEREAAAARRELAAAAGEAARLADAAVDGACAREEAAALQRALAAEQAACRAALDSAAAAVADARLAAARVEAERERALAAEARAALAAADAALLREQLRARTEDDGGGRAGQEAERALGLAAQETRRTAAALATAERALADERTRRLPCAEYT